MAITQNTYTGNGSTVLYSFTFPYLSTSDVYVALNGTLTTAYTFANATTIQFNSAPANGVQVLIYRSTDSASQYSTFYPGSSIKASDLNDNFTQDLFLSQEAVNTSVSALISAASAVTTATTASTNASAAVATANTASSGASAAVATANTASTNASNAVTTANTATATANSATSTANTALSTANTASSNAAAAVSTANTASTNASAAVSTVNTANTNASAAVTTANSALSIANTASTNASSAVATATSANTTANTASTNASAAVTTANAAQADATNAIAAVAAASLYVIVANVAAIPTTSLTNNQGIQVTNTTGLGSFTPLSGIPVGFVGNAAVYARIRYSTSTSSWVWVDYAANDPEGRYLAKTGGTMTGALVLSGAPTVGLNPTTKTYVDAADSTLTTAAAAAQSTANTANSTANTALTNAATAQSTANTGVTNAAAAQSTANTANTTANAALPKAGGAMTGDITLNAQSDLRFADADSSNWVAFHAPAIIAANVTWTLPATDASVSGYALKSNGSGQLSWGLAGGALGSGANQIFYENDQTVTGNYSITAGKNAMTAGPVTVNSGVTVTVPSGSSWSII